VTLPVVFHDLAEDELNEAAAYYARARPGLGDAFLSEVRHAVDALAASPLAGNGGGERDRCPAELGDVVLVRAADLLDEAM
jgi:plasmid stabilization system protein ParE